MKDIAPQTRKILQTFVWWGHELTPQPPATTTTTTTTTIQTSAKFCDFAEMYRFVGFQQITFKLGSFTNFKAFFPAMLTNFR